MKQEVFDAQSAAYYNLLLGRLDESILKEFLVMFPPELYFDIEKAEVDLKRQRQSEIYKLFVEFFIIFLSLRNITELSFLDDYDSIVRSWEQNFSTLRSKFTNYTSLTNRETDEVKRIYSLLENDSNPLLISSLESYLMDKLEDAKNEFEIFSREVVPEKCNVLIISSTPLFAFDSFVDMNKSIERKRKRVN